MGGEHPRSVPFPRRMLTILVLWGTDAAFPLSLLQDVFRNFSISILPSCSLKTRVGKLDLLSFLLVCVMCYWVDADYWWPYARMTPTVACPQQLLSSCRLVLWSQPISSLLFLISCCVVFSSQHYCLSQRTPSSHEVCEVGQLHFVTFASSHVSGFICSRTFCLPM